MVEPVRKILARIAPSVISLMLALFQFTAIAQAQDATQKATNSDDFRELLNENSVTLIAGTVTGAYVPMADDISKAIDGSGVRLITMLGSGVHNVRDVLYLRGVDMGIVQSDALETFKGKRFYENIKDRLQYIVNLHIEEVHLFGRAGTRSATELNGKVVAFHNAAAASSGEVILRKLGIKPKTTFILDMFDAAEKIRTGEVDAVLRVVGKPVRGVDRMQKSYPELVLIPIPFDVNLLESYVPTTLNHADYPELIPENAPVESLAITAVLTVYNWKVDSERYRRLEKFVNAFFSNFEKLKENKSRHPKWDEINLAGRLSGWTRFAPAERWIRDKFGAEAASGGDRQEFKRFLRERTGTGQAMSAGPDEEDRIFGEFLRWRKNRR